MPDTYGWIWPKDPRPGNPTHWPRRWRWLDLLTNRGPDIFVGRLHQTKTDKNNSGDQTRELSRKGKSTPTPASTHWSRWELEDNTKTNEESHIHPVFRTNTNPNPNPNPARHKHPRDSSPFPWARRQSAERYDFRTKRYCIPNSGTWSRVQYCNADKDTSRQNQNHVIPVRYWDRYGNEYPAGYWHDVVYGRDRCDRGCCLSRCK